MTKCMTAAVPTSVHVHSGLKFMFVEEKFKCGKVHVYIHLLESTCEILFISKLWVYPTETDSQDLQYAQTGTDPQIRAACIL